MIYQKIYSGKAMGGYLWRSVHFQKKSASAMRVAMVDEAKSLLSASVFDCDLIPLTVGIFAGALVYIVLGQTFNNVWVEVLMALIWKVGK